MSRYLQRGSADATPGGETRNIGPQNSDEGGSGEEFFNLGCGDDYRGGWVNIDLDEPARVEGDRIFLPGRPAECPECGDRVLEYNSVEVTFHA